MLMKTLPLQGTEQQAVYKVILVKPQLCKSCHSLVLNMKGVSRVQRFDIVGTLFGSSKKVSQNGHGRGLLGSKAGCDHNVLLTCSNSIQEKQQSGAMPAKLATRTQSVAAELNDPAKTSMSAEESVPDLSQRVIFPTPLAYKMAFLLITIS